MAKKAKTPCRKCSDDAFCGGLCKKHYDIKVQSERDGLALLDDCIIDGELAVDSVFRDEIFELRKHWDTVCAVRVSGRARPEMPLDEAISAEQWCINWSAELAHTIRKERLGLRVEGICRPMCAHARERFANLAKGLMSNGIPRVSRDD